MLDTLKTSLGSAALALVIGSSAATAADLGGYRNGSIKDGYVPMAPVVAAGPCYVRSDVGYSWSRTPDASYIGNGVNANDPHVWGEKLDNNWLFEAGIGCGMGSRGIRGELVWGVRGERDFKGEYNDYSTGAPLDPHLRTTLRTYTMMFNAYHDFGRFGSVVPYVGAGLGWAYHKMGDVTSDAALSPNPQLGEDKLSFAWSLMAGFGYQLSDRAILDIGYRYIDMGSARSSHNDSTNSWNPRLEIDDQRAHEMKIGIRYHFGSTEPAPAFAPMK